MQKQENSVAKNNFDVTHMNTQNGSKCTYAFVRFDFRLLKICMVKDGLYFLQICLQEKFYLIVIIPAKVEEK